MLMPIFSAKPQEKSPTHGPQATNFGSRVFHTTEDSNGKVSVFFSELTCLPFWE
jgi:hypothetical protein